MARTIHVFDTSAILRFLDKEAGYVRVAEILLAAQHGQCNALISAVNWGELVGKLHKRRGVEFATEVCAQLARNGLQIVPATAERAAASGNLKADLGIPYADCFGVQLTQDSSNHHLITADFDVKPAESLIHIEFLPTKPTP